MWIIPIWLGLGFGLFVWYLYQYSQYDWKMPKLFVLGACLALAPLLFVAELYYILFK